jgi:hypothetical protein
MLLDHLPIGMVGDARTSLLHEGKKRKNAGGNGIGCIR